ncbi:MAG: glycosyltransferase family 4 protein [Magnetococcales bacterium]|nr:glycosyltransferase family 4 protein [Magnetococcales bacterium]
MKIALVSTGHGRIHRGFEAFTGSLFENLRRRVPDLDVTLFAGGGEPEERRVVVPNLHRHDLPARWFGEFRANLLEKRSFALAIYAHLRRGGHDLVHYNELVMGSALFHLRRRFGGHFKLLYCNGAPSPAVHYHHRCDYAQLLTGPGFEEAVSFGMEARRLFLLPYGLDADRFHPRTALSREAVRRELGIPPEAVLVLTVAALKREHKRIDYLLQEMGGLPERYWLVAAGQRTGDTPALEEEGRRLLGDRFRFLTWPAERVALLYGAADLFVLCSLTEAFGLVTVEAMLSGVPVIAHRGPVYQWLAEGTGARLIDMAQEGRLRQAIAEMPQALPTREREEAAFRRFSWEMLIREYVAMYESVCSGSPLS